MQVQYEALYHQLEENHWWFRGRRAGVFDQLQQMNLPKTAAILEIGCSGGPLQQQLRAIGFHNLTGIDISEAAIALAHQRRIPNVSVMDGARLEFADNSFDVVVASDVLEHIEDEQRALREWRRVLKPGGQLLVYVPAFPQLWSQHDVVNRHFRRYTAASLGQALTAAALQVQRKSYWNFALFFPTFLVRQAQRLRGPVRPEAESGTGDLLALPAPVNTSLIWLLRAENCLLRHLNLPVGVSVFALARKPAA
ncbi:class I SAM-dependent methyltransferase [Hymenobacter endophyticus]|uniref:Class I SAM-dependent methyltransferase n=1 Tax=Hymenobacter endophyticus TaxID=3076335 RepID=A0ABU3TH46_9BACT|nr:class I SAM-dependent methyltransferase [Hymenobacter endophyticus]MDU0370684.1 class I SAM-dependent methyltransferase [Hymenobacter endophyticus]